MTPLRAATLALGLLVAAPAAVAQDKAAALAVETPWVRATPGGSTITAGYVRVTNRGGEADRLLGGSLSGAGRAELHRTSEVNGISRMAPVEGGLPLAPGATVELAPGGNHLMFMDLATPLKAGETLQGTLLFEKAGRVPVTFTVQGIGARAPSSAGHRGH